MINTAVPYKFTQVILNPSGNSHWNHGSEFYNQEFQRTLSALAISDDQVYYLFSADRSSFRLVSRSQSLEEILPVIASGNVLVHCEPSFI